jgi:peptidoglycan/LPS O-acetylase OafA/YrhL
MALSLLLFMAKVSAESPECKAEWQKVLASQDPATSAGKDYQNMALYSGIIINSLGNYDSCNKIEIARYVVLTYSRSRPAIVQTFCGPIACTKEDYYDSTLPYIQGTPLDVEFPHKYQEDYYSSYTPSAILMLVLMFWLIGIAVIATATEYFTQSEEEESMWYKALLCFSLIKNGKMILAQRSQEKFGKTDTFDVLDAARVMSIGWVISYHVVAIQCNSSVLNNFDTIYDELGESKFLIALTGTYAVDTFFWISGFLMAYFFLVELEKAENFTISDLLKHYLHRYLRITPAILFVILFFMSMQKYIGNGPIFTHVTEKSALTDCDDYFYTNILYLNNIIPNFKGNNCLSHSWYLAVDMQCFIIFSLVIVVYSKLSKALGWIIIAAACCCGIITSGVIATHYELKVGAFMSGNEYDWYYYRKPYTRTPPYALAVGAGIVVYSYRQLQKNGQIYDKFANYIANALNNTYVKYGTFFLGLSLINTFIWAQYDVYSHPGPNYEYEEWSDSQSAAFIAFERFGFGLGVSFILIPLLLGHFSWIIGFMGFIPWSYFSRVSFVVYLIHFPIIFVVLLSQRAVDELNIFNTIRNTVYFFVLSCFCAVPIVLLIEFPILNVDKLFLRRSERPIKYQLLPTEDQFDKKKGTQDN